jgi:formate hydrogenlyase transcriptional activator
MMNNIYLVFTYITAWTSLAIGVLCLLIAIRGNKPTDLAYSLVGLTLIIFFTIAPQGFSVINTSIWGVIVTKRIAVALFYLATPAFLLLFGSVQKKLILSALFIAIGCYPLVFILGNDLKIVWSIAAGVAITGLFILGLRAAVWQYQQPQENNRIRLFVAALSIYQALFLLTLLIRITRLFPGVSSMPSLFVPSLIFILSIVVMLLANLVQRAKLEKVFHIHEKRLQSFMENAPLMVMELDREGHLTYINDFGAKLLGYEKAEEIANINWFSTFLLPSDIGLLKKLYLEIFNGNLRTSTFKNTVRCKNDLEIIINWVNFIAPERDGSIQKVISIGRDISGEESAGRLVAQLQKELEKENIDLQDTVQFELEENVVGKSKAFTYAIQRARQVAITHAPVLLEGETGVGKEVFANLIHKNSSRCNMPFIKVNCGALPKELIEDELFGHEKGAFTSAIQARKGRFELADGGTIFLDEIGELPLDMQPKLLRVLQNGEFERVGGQKTIKVDVRILAATNRNLLEEINNGNFREDLYYRLNVFPITIPALRNRKEDLPDLIHFFITTKCKEYNKTIQQVSRTSLQRLVDYRWPGNIRELKNVIERSVIVSEGHLLKFDWWFDTETAVDESSAQTLEKVETDHIMAVMEKCNWKINGDNGAAEILNMHPNTLRSKMKRLGIARPKPKKSEPSIPQAEFFFPRESMG